MSQTSCVPSYAFSLYIIATTFISCMAKNISDGSERSIAVDKNLQ